jgi:hypothetical protein
VRAVIRFLNAQNVRPIEIYRQLIAAYGEGVMNDSNVRKWRRMFNEGRTNLHDGSDPGARPSSLRYLKNRIERHIRTNSSFWAARACVAMK